MLMLLAVAAFGAGIVNALAGGGAFLTFPSLIAAGIPAIDANASSTVALSPGQFVTAWASRDAVKSTPQEWKSLVISLSIISLLGGTAGAVLLLVTPSQAFSKLVPWLLMFATLVFAIGGRLQRGDGRRWLGPVSIKVVHGLISIYGGYFGGGIGILMLAALSIYGMRDIRQMNGIKVIFAGLMNATATIIFVVAGRVHWLETSVMMAAAIVGGYSGAKLGGYLPSAVVRTAVIAVGVILTIYFFLKPV